MLNRVLFRYIPKHRIQYKVWWFVTSQPFEYAIFVLIMINTITLAMKYHNQPPDYSKALDMLNMLFTAVFALEFIFKLAAFRFKVNKLFFPFANYIVHWAHNMCKKTISFYIRLSPPVLLPRDIISGQIGKVNISHTPMYLSYIYIKLRFMA